MLALRPVISSDKAYFSKWWRDPDLIRVTSGDFSSLSDEDIEKYFKGITTTAESLHYMIMADGQTIGHISLQKRKDDWWETQIVIGDKRMQGKGFGTEAITALVNKAYGQNIRRIYLEVRPDNQKAVNAYLKAGFRQVNGDIVTNNALQPTLIRMEYQSL